MKKNKFKELYNNYKKEENKKNENALCREIINNSNFIVCEKENSLDTYRDENEKLVLKVYTELNEINEYVRNQFTTTEVDFNTIWSTINRNMLDKIIINPESDRFMLSNEQINDLYRQDKFGDKISYRTIKKNFMQEKSAYKVENIKSLNNKTIEIYKKYVDSNNENDLNDFYKELVYNATFYTRVLPENNGKLDSNNNPIIDYTRVMQNFLDDNGNERCYILYLTIEALKKDGAKEDSKKQIHINNGEVVILYGPSGSGKSTFMKMLTERIRLEKSTEIPSTSRFLFYDEKLKFGSLSIFEELFCCEENPNLTKMQTILENLHLWCEIKSNCFDVWKWMKEKRFDQSLSNGQKQRLILAKMLYWLNDDIDVLVLDECTSGLDDKSETDSADAERILEYIVRYANSDKKRIIIISTHQNIDGFKCKLADKFKFRNLQFAKEEEKNLVKEV